MRVKLHGIGETAFLKHLPEVPAEHEGWTLPVPTDEDVKRAEKLGEKLIKQRGYRTSPKRAIQITKTLKGRW